MKSALAGKTLRAFPSPLTQKGASPVRPRSNGVRSTRPLLLGVETSCPVFSVAISEGPHLVRCLHLNGTGRPSVLLAGMIQEVLAQANWKISQLDGFTISIGPGSFTGLRVGVTTIKTLAWALKKPVLPISSLEVIAQNLADRPRLLCPFLDARKGKVYTALFSSNGSGGLKRLKEDRLSLPEEAFKGLTQPTLLIGDGIRRYPDLVSSWGGQEITIAPEASWIPSAENLCRIAARRWPEGSVDDPHRLVPEYLYSQESDITGW